MKMSVIYWSGTGNTAAMAKAIAEGAGEAGAEVKLLEVGSASAADVSDADLVATKVLRVVDWFGKRDAIADCGKELDNLIHKNNYEYVDFYCYGMPYEAMEKCGFIRRTKDDANIIPNHFHPFEQKNIDIYFYTWYKDKIAVFRGYGDQDRPN